MISYLCILFIKNSCFINNFDDFFKIFQDFSRFFMFYSRSWMMFHYILCTKHSCFVNNFQDFSRFFRIFQDFSGFFKIFQDFPRFFMFYSRYWVISYYIFKKNYSSFINDFDTIFKIFQDFSRFFMNFQDFSWFFFLHFIFVHHFAMIKSCISPYYYNCFHIAPYLKVWTFHCCMHSLEIQCIQQWIQSIQQIATYWTAYMRKRSKKNWMLSLIFCYFHRCRFSYLVTQILIKLRNHKNKSSVQTTDYRQQGCRESSLHCNPLQGQNRVFPV